MLTTYIIFTKTTIFNTQTCEKANLWSIFNLCIKEYKIELALKNIEK